jgi:hypothetical protein
MRSLGDFGMGPVCYLGDRGERIGSAAREIIIADRVGDDLNMQSAHCRNPAPVPAAAPALNQLSCPMRQPQEGLPRIHYNAQVTGRVYPGIKVVPTIRTVPGAGGGLAAALLNGKGG